MLGLEKSPIKETFQLRPPIVPGLARNRHCPSSRLTDVNQVGKMAPWKADGGISAGIEQAELFRVGASYAQDSRCSALSGTTANSI